MPRISVIVPVYKVEKYLHRCVRSIQQQSLRELEIILVDDGSPDESGRLCDGFAEQDSRIKVIHKENGGLSDARNAGLEVATGEYIGFVDSDDHIAPTMYACLLQALEDGAADMSICGYDFVDEADNVDEAKRCPLKTGVLTGREALTALDTLEGDYFYYATAWNKLYKRELFAQLRFPKGKLHEDEFIAHRVFARCDRVAVVDGHLYSYVQRSGSIMSSRPSVRSLDGVQALLERSELYRSMGMRAQERNVLRTAGWKLGQLMQALPFSDRRAVNAMAKRLLPKVLPAHWKRGLLLSKDWLRYLLRGALQEARHRRFLHHYEKNCAVSSLLLDTPEHENLGDHAIVLAQLQFLREHCPERPILEVTADRLDGREAEFAARTPVGKTVFIHGGGFLGCLWPLEEERFRRIVKAFDRQKLVVFPQTVTFDLTTQSGRDYLRRSQEIYCAHPDLTIFVREEQSLAFMQTHFPKVKTRLVPDTVVLLRQPLPQYRREDILLCLRGDVERKLTDEEHGAIVEALEQVYPGVAVRRTDTVSNNAIAPAKRSRAVEEKLKEFSRARLLITDRLHGMVFAALTETPCIALGNSNGKVRGVYRWLESQGYICYLDDLQQLQQTLRELDTDRRWTYHREQLLTYFEPLRDMAQQ